MFNLPTSTLVNRKIPKNKFYEKLQASNRLKEMFTQQVESIVWKHKLAKETLRIEPKDNIEEIQIFEIHLKEKTYSIELLRSIDRSIPYPVLHVLLYQAEAKLAIAYKERNLVDNNRAVIHSYHETDWQPKENIQINLVQGLHLKEVYENIIRHLLIVKVNPEEEIAVAIELQAQINRLKDEIKRLKARLRREKQFNRKVDINLELQQKRKELNQLLSR